MNARRQIIAALSEDSLGGIATLQDVTHAEQLVDAHRAEALAEAIRLIDDHPHPGNDPAAFYSELLASLLPGGEKATAAAATATPDPDFFEPGRTYTEPGDITDWRFRCDAITTHPGTGERTALGWKHFRGEWAECSYAEDEWEIHQIADAIGTANTTTGDSK